ncbi:c-type cytochrome [Psychroserpens sp.]|uniref:c-type cytochrome n=1 Tax=Psychroserpens sp. TaxID=2020870 RepID=UPI00385E5ABC
MKTTLKLMMVLFVTLLLSCGGKEEKKKEPISYGRKEVPVKKEAKASKTPASKRIDLSNKGVGPITSVTLDAEIDQNMVTEGAEIFKKMCTACHRPNKKFIGPSPKGLLARRSPEWIMNMILDPEGMVKNDPLAKELLIEFNGSPMANQNLTEDEARKVLEYFRTL